MNRIRTFLGPSLGLLAAALAPHVSGCNATVTNGNPDDGKGSSKAVAQQPTEADPSSGKAFDDGSIVISLASDPLTCSSSGPTWLNDDPSEMDCPEASHWWVRFRLPPNKQQPGVYSLADLDGYFEEIIAESESACGFGGGSFVDGTVEVVSIDGESITVTLDDTFSFSGNSADGTYEVPFCSPPEPPAPQPGTINAVAHEDDGTYYYEDENTSVVVSSSSGGAEPKLALTVGNLVEACSANLPDCGAPGWAVSVKLPVEYQAVGTYSLDTPELEGFFSVTFPSSGPDDCSGGGGSFWDGTISILSIDAGSVTFELAGTSTLFEYASADGVYTAPRCN